MEVKTFTLKKLIESINEYLESRWEWMLERFKKKATEIIRKRTMLGEKFQT